jgi:hypothetical protein
VGNLLDESKRVMDGLSIGKIGGNIWRKSNGLRAGLVRLSTPAANCVHQHSVSLNRSASAFPAPLRELSAICQSQRRGWNNSTGLPDTNSEKPIRRRPSVAARWLEHYAPLRKAEGNQQN